jgi:hypothetical protein
MKKLFTTKYLLISLGGVILLAVASGIYLTTIGRADTKTNQKIIKSSSKQVTIAASNHTYDGTYVGATGVANGLADATLRISGGMNNGGAKYKGTISGMSINASVGLAGIVTEAGKITGNINGATSVMGQKINITGSYSGQVKGNSINATYSVSALGQNRSGNIVLTKQ